MIGSLKDPSGLIVGWRCTIVDRSRRTTIEVHAGVWPGAALVRGERCAVGLDDPEREHHRLARSRMHDVELVEPVLARRLHGDAALLAPAAPPQAASSDHERTDERDSVAAMLAWRCCSRSCRRPRSASGPQLSPAAGGPRAVPSRRRSTAARASTSSCSRRGRVVIVPAAIGLRGARADARPGDARPLPRTRSGRPTRPASSASSRGRRSAISSRVWGRPLGPDRLLGFTGAVRVYVNGIRRKSRSAGVFACATGTSSCSSSARSSRRIAAIASRRAERVTSVPASTWSRSTITTHGRDACGEGGDARRAA